jgi:hypothetical protein
MHTGEMYKDAYHKVLLRKYMERTSKSTKGEKMAYVFNE